MIDFGWRRRFEQTRRRLHETSRRRAAKVKPDMEPLDDRTVPAVYTVTGLLDGPGTVTSTGVGTFDATTLRGAISAANATSADDTINLPVGTINLTVDGNGDDNNNSGDLDVRNFKITNGDLTIVGQGTANSIVNAAFSESNDRVFHIIGGEGGQVILRGFTVQNGKASFSNAEDIGGGILNETDTLRLENMLVQNNQAIGPDQYGGGQGQGGGIFNRDFRTLVVQDSVVLNNTATSAGKFGEFNEGGGIYNDYGGSLSVTGSTLQGNIALGGSSGGEGDAGHGHGGGIFNREQGTTTITSSILLNNTARGGDGDDGDGEGGGIYNDDYGGTVSILNSTLQGNKAIGGDYGGNSDGQGGAVYNSSESDLTIEGSQLLSNQALGGSSDGSSEIDSDGQGGGIFNTGGMVVLKTTTIDGNKALGGTVGDYGGSIGAGEGLGGGVYTEDGTVTIDRSTLSNNSALGGDSLDDYGGGGDGQGGGYYALESQTDITNSTFSGNIAKGADANAFGDAGEGNGGGLYFCGCEGFTANLTNVTVTQNDATNGQGGIIAFRSGGSDLGGGIYKGENSTVNLFNTIVAKNTAADGTLPDDLFGPFNSLGHNLIGTIDGASGLTNGVNGDQVGTDDALVDPGLDPLADNGGPTKTHALKATSNARNTGSNVEAPLIDQRGLARPQELITDIGAYEFVAPTPPPPTPPVTSADVGVTKTAILGKRVIRQGRRQRNVTFKVVVKNNGPGVATNVTLDDLLPTRFKLLSFSTDTGSVSVSNGRVVGNLGTLAAGGTATITLSGRLTRFGVVFNTATVPLATYDPNPANNSSTAMANNGIPLFNSDIVLKHR